MHRMKSKDQKNLYDKNDQEHLKLHNKLGKLKNREEEEKI